MSVEGVDGPAHSQPAKGELNLGLHLARTGQLQHCHLAQRGKGSPRPRNLSMKDYQLRISLTALQKILIPRIEDRKGQEGRLGPLEVLLPAPHAENKELDQTSPSRGRLQSKEKLSSPPVVSGRRKTLRKGQKGNHLKDLQRRFQPGRSQQT